jgi:hypothetical protein
MCVAGWRDSTEFLSVSLVSHSDGKGDEYRGGRKDGLKNETRMNNQRKGRNFRGERNISWRERWQK